jgi:WD40 repeat protein/uncharacterized caspase-like protein
MTDRSRAISRRSGFYPAVALALLTLSTLAGPPVRAQDRASSAPVTFVVDTGHGGIVEGVIFSADGTVVISQDSPTSSKATLKVWEAKTGRLLKTLEAPKSVTGKMVISPDRRRVVAECSDSLIGIWDLETGLLLRTIQGPTDGWGQIVAMPRRGNLMVTSDYKSKSLRLWDVETARQIRTIESGYSDLADIVFSEDEAELIAIDSKNTIVRWDVKTGKLLSSARIEVETDFWSARLSPGGRFVVVKAKDKAKPTSDLSSGFLVDTRTGKVALQFNKSTDTSSRAFAFSSNDNYLVSAEEKNAAKVWDVAAGRLLRTLTGPADSFRSMAVSSDAATVLAGSADHKLRSWDIAANTAPSEYAASSSAVFSIRFALDGRLLVSGRGGTRKTAGTWAGEGEASVHLWDAGAGKLLQSFIGQATWLEPLGVSPDGSTLVTAHLANLRFWDLASGRLLGSQDTRHQAEIGNIEFSRDGKIFATGGGYDHSVIIWNAETRKPLRTLQGGENVLCLAVAPDGKRIAVGYPTKHFKLWDVATGKIVREFRGHGGFVSTVAFAPDGKTIASSGEDAKIRIWDAETGRQIKVLSGHEDQVSSLAYDSTGKQILSAATDGTARLWNAESGELARTFRGHVGNVNDARFSGTSRRISSVGQDGSIRIWDIDSGQTLVTIAMFGAGEWIAITPEGFFDTSSAADSLKLAVVRGLDAYSASQFYQALYRPDLVREKLAGDPRGLVGEAAARLDLNTVLASGKAPDVHLTSPARGLGRVADKDATIDAEISDRGGGIGRVEWRVNGITTGIDTPALAAPGQPVRLTRNLALEPGDNTIEVVAYNNANLIASVPGRISLASQASAAVANPPPGSSTEVPSAVVAANARLFVLAAGSDQYEDKRLRLRYSVPDAKAMAQALADSGKALYQAVEVKLLSDSEVVTGTLDAAFQELSKKIQPTDVFVLYLAGHGKTVDGRYYFVPQNFKFDGDVSASAVDAAVRAQGIAQEQWQRWLAAIPARKSVILFDTCESGTLAGDAAETKTLERGAANDRLAEATGRSIMTASSGSTEAFEGYHGHGLFTYNLLDALEKGDGDNSGTIELTELAAFVYAQVTSISANVFKRRQEPQIRITLNYPLTKQANVLKEDATPVAEAKPTNQLAQTASLQIRPASGATVVRSLLPKTAVTVLSSEGGWLLIASKGKQLGYVATRDLAPLQAPRP